MRRWRLVLALTILAAIGAIVASFIPTSTTLVILWLAVALLAGAAGSLAGTPSVEHSKKKKKKKKKKRAKKRKKKKTGVVRSTLVRDDTSPRRGYGVSAKYSNPDAFSQHSHRPHDVALRPTGRRHDAATIRGKNPGDVWSISTRPLRDAHFAAFSIDIPLRCIAAGCPPDGLVLDPFSGAATTGLAARQLGRSYIGIDLNPKFHDIGVRRLGLHASLKGRAA